MKWSDRDSAILIQYDPKRIENTYYADLALFLHGMDIPSPRLIRHDPTNGLILMEDLGDMDLWSLRNAPWETRRTLYQRTLIIIHKLHSFPEEGFPFERVRLMEGFGPDLYRWEQEYFKDHFVQGVCGIPLESSFEQSLDTELSFLADRLLKTERCLIHRDLQSQNVMIRDGKPYLIDFQGMRFGSRFYDLGSLLCDPYVEFSGDQRMELLHYYYNLSKQDQGWKEFQDLFWVASIQRLMQALGAFGFLGLQKGLKSFLAHIPSGLRNLELALLRGSICPSLLLLVRRCQERIERKGVHA